MAFDPTNYIPLGYEHSGERASAVYYNAFLTACEFIFANRVEGHFFEFGVYRGYTARLLATFINAFQLNSSSLYLFDSFEGLPEVSNVEDRSTYEVTAKYWQKGTMGLPPGIEQQIRDILINFIPSTRLFITKGFFSDTLGETIPDGVKASLVHVDCDLYSSARFCLDTAFEKNLFQDGTILMLDDWNCCRGNPLMGERRAVRDAFATQERFYCEDFYSYGWNGKSLIVHDSQLPVVSD